MNVIIYFSEQASIATKFRPLFDRVLVKRLDAVKQSKGGIMLPESASKKILEATVVAVGPGARNQVFKYQYITY
jgi:chaperonin GroES